MSGAVNANAVEINGIYYNLMSDMTAEVTYPNNGRYSLDIEIPSKIDYNGVSYEVTKIGSCAFLNCYSLTSIKIPNSVKSIGGSAFRYCISLPTIDIPNSVTSIGGEAFYACSGLTSVTIPNSVTTIEYSTFWGCSILNNIIIPSSVTSIGYRAFASCHNLTTIKIPNSITSIGNEAFEGCNALTHVTIPNSVTSIGNSAFWNCSGLTSINIPSSVTNIGSGAFGYCSNLSSINVEKDNLIYDSRENCNAIIETSTNTLIKGCKKTKIPNSVMNIGIAAFQACTGMTSITIPNSVKSIGDRAFSECDDLLSIISEIQSPFEFSGDVFTDYSKPTLTVPAGTKAAYQATKYWSLFMNIAEADGVNDIGNTTSFSRTYDVYNMKGNGVRIKVSSLDRLSPGVYIIDNKKIIKK